KAWWYIPRGILSFDDQKGTQGTDHYVAPNPPFGAVLTYYLKDGLKTKEALRKESEVPLRKQNKNIPFPGWDALEAERRQGTPHIWLTIKDASGNVVRKIEGPVGKGFHRIAWDLKYPSVDAIRLDASSPTSSSGLMAAPGTYTASLSKQVDGVVTELSKPITFTVEPLRPNVLAGATPAAAAEFWRKYEKAARNSSGLSIRLDNALKKIAAMEKALTQTTAAPGNLEKEMYALRQELLELNKQLNGDGPKQEVGEKSKPVISQRLFAVSRSIYHSTYGPTETASHSLEIVETEIKDIDNKLTTTTNKMKAVSNSLKEAGAPWVEGDF
ncbi:MAG TPA: glycosyl hydrolase, partial [Cyclobacteriaceae bacterium]